MGFNNKFTRIIKLNYVNRHIVEKQFVLKKFPPVIHLSVKVRILTISQKVLTERLFVGGIY
ncbi:hypothetical protein CBW16_04780 [Flavobacteriaceae bacterium JJC]|nr:hypothetical protein CBW16_04780 [Flavobacteriaceae bacterium JJC]